MQTPKILKKKSTRNYGKPNMAYLSTGSNEQTKSGKMNFDGGTGTAKEEVDGFTNLGSDAPVIKMKKLTGTTGDTEGDQTNIAHGLTVSKIIACDVLVTANNNNLIPPEFSEVSGFQYSVFIDATNVRIDLHATTSETIISGAITVLLIYEE